MNPEQNQETRGKYRIDEVNGSLFIESDRGCHAKAYDLQSAQEIIDALNSQNPNLNGQFAP
jgi:hypothetical protein